MPQVGETRSKTRVPVPMINHADNYSFDQSYSYELLQLPSLKGVAYYVEYIMMEYNIAVKSDYRLVSEVHK